MEMIVKVFDLCMFNRRVWFTTVNTTIDFNEPKVEVEVFPCDHVGIGQSQSKLPRTKYHWSVSRVKERAIGSIEKFSMR